MCGAYDSRSSKQRRIQMDRKGLTEHRTWAR
jgi:hypothetical protein